jgi:hypothetical protein
MSVRVWIAVLLTAAVIAALASYGYSRRGTAILLSQHSMPAIHLPAQEVAVTPQGKLFHDPSCRYIHGKAEMMSAPEAAKRGYTPCPRCLGKYLRR